MPDRASNARKVNCVRLMGPLESNFRSFKDYETGALDGVGLSSRCFAIIGVNTMFMSLALIGEFGLCLGMNAQDQESGENATSQHKDA